MIYRCTPRENAKRRPSFYSKRLCLLSFLRAVRACSPPPEVVYWTDGEMPEELLSLMRESGDVVSTPRSGGAGSYLAAVDFALARLQDDDFVYFGEDDYLFQERALSDLAAAEAGLPQASYFALYASIFWPRSTSYWVDEALWATASSTTYSFAARVGALRADRRIHDLCLRVGDSPDAELGLAYQGVPPYGWRKTLGEAVLGPTGWETGRWQRVKRSGARLWVNVIAWRRGFRPRVLVTRHPAAATHCEVDFLAEGDWDAIAAETEEWSRRALGLDIAST